MQRRLFICALLAPPGLIGCAASGPLFTQRVDRRPGQAILYVYRPTATGLAILSAIIEIDGRPMATLENGEYAAIALPPGTYTVVQRWKAGVFGNAKLEDRPISHQLFLTSDSESFIRLGMDSSWGASGIPLVVRNEWRWNLQSVPGSEALPEIALCRRGQFASARDKPLERAGEATQPLL